MKITELHIEVEDVDEFNDAADEILTEYCEELELIKGMHRPVIEEDEGYADLSFIWNDKAIILINKKIDELYAIGEKHFGVTLDLNISSHMYKEP